MALDITYLLKKYAEMLEKGKTADGRRRGAASSYTLQNDRILRTILFALTSSRFSRHKLNIIIIIIIIMTVVINVNVR